MKVACLVENTTERSDITAEHGLSLYIETGDRKILFDTGQTGVLVENAVQMGIDLAAVDCVVLSHGHYDHGGGLARFFEVNQKAPVYAQRRAFEPYYHGKEKYIGLDPDLRNSGRFILTDDAFQIGEGLTLVTCNERPTKYPIQSYGLQKMQDGVLVPDDFRHEQYLLIEEKGRTVAVSGCSHKGILNIMHWLEPDVLIGGFHFMKLDPSGDGAGALKRAAEELAGYRTMYYTCHCTGIPQYACLKTKLHDQLRYLHAGETLDV